MKAIKTIVKTYSGADRRELLPKKSEIAGVVGDNLTTKFIFKIPAEYDNWDKFIRWHCTVTDDDGQTIVNPVYPLDADNSFTLPGELIPDNDMIVGYNLTFYGTDGVNELAENSITSTVYIESTREPFAAGTTEDIVRRLLEAAISTIQTLEYAEDPQAATTTQPARPYLIATKKYGDVENIILNLPYLNQDGYIDDRFYAPSRMPSRVYVLTDSVTPASEQLTELTDARMEDMAYFTDGAEAGSMYILTVDDPTHEENWKSILPDKVLTAIANNASNILAETQRATGVENSIISDLSAEISTRTTETAALRHDLTEEEGTRTQQYAELSGAITAEEGRATEAESALSTAITDEEGRATGAETTLRNALIEEESQRRAADGALQAAIGSEASSRSEKDTQLEEAISEEESERVAADAELEQTINSVGSELISLLNTKRDKIVVSHPDSNVVYTQDGSGHEGLFYLDQTSATGGSIVARTSSGTIVTASPSDNNDATTKGYVDQADDRKIDKTSIVSVDWSAEPSNTNVPSELLTKTKIDAEVTRATGAENSLSSAITSEETNRIEQYNSLSADISNETTSRENADDNILSLLTTETTGREQGDSDLLERLNQEIQARIQGDADEKSQREEADGDLHDYIDDEIEGVEGTISTVDGRVTDEITRATGVESGLRSDLTAETTAREAADTALQTDVDSRVPKTFSATVFVGASVPNGNVTESGVSVQFATKNTNNNTTGTITMPLPVATSTQAGVVTASQIAQIAQNRADIETLMGKSTRYAIDVDLTGMTDAQVQTALTTAWRTASGTPTGNPAQYTTLVNLWNNHEYTWLTVGSTTQWEDRGISTVSIATTDSLGVVMGTPDPGDNSTNGGVYVDENGQMTVIGWDDITSDISNLQSNVSSLQSGKVSKVSQTGTGYVSSVSINATDKTQLDVTRTALPALSKGSTTGDGNAVTDISVSGHTISLTKGTTFLTAQDITGKMNTDMSNIAVAGTKADGKTVVWDATNSRWTYGEAGKVDDVQVNNVSVVTNKVANITVPSVYDNKIQFKVGNTVAQEFTANQSSDVALSFEGSGGTTVTADNSAKKITISSTAVNNGTLTIKGGTTTATTFSANSSASPTLTISGSGGTTVTGGSNTITISSTAVNNGTLTIKSKAKSEAESTTTSEVTLGTFTANQSSGSTIKIPIPTKVSDLDNDTGFITGLSFDDLTSHPTTLAGYGITDALPSNHVYPISLTKTGTASITLAHNTTYTLTAGGSSVVFKTPADNDTKAWASITGKPFVSFGDTIEVVNNVANVKLGYSASGKNYAIAKDSNGKLYVNVPWENTHYTATPILGASTATSNATSATANDATYLNIIENSTKSGGIQVTGSGGTTVSAVSGKLTITSPSVPSAYTSAPAALGTASAGSSGNWARGDHVHPKPSLSDLGAAAATHAHGNITSDGKLGTASRVVITDGSKNITTDSNIDTTELSYLNGVTSNIQTQINDKMKRGTYERIEGTSSAHKDLNNYYTPGFYNVKGLYTDNCPLTTDTDYYLMVMPWNKDSWCTQFLISGNGTPNSGKMWYRTTTNGTATTWGGWVRAPSATEIPTNTNQLTNGAGFITSSGSITGNAATATAFSAAKSVTLTGDVTGTASSTAGWSVATTLAASGVTAGSYGPSSNATPAYGATFNVPYITVDAKGRITAASTKTVKIPASDNTHYTANLITGATATDQSNAANTTTNSIFLNLVENSTVRNSHNIVGSGGTTVACDANGKITITSPSLGTGASDAAKGDHIHSASLTAAGSSGTTLAHNTWYTLTAGGSSVIFKTPADNNTDTKVTQTVSTAADKFYPLLASATANASSTGTTTSVFAADMKLNPGKLTFNKSTSYTSWYQGSGGSSGGYAWLNYTGTKGNFFPFLNYKSTNGHISIAGYQDKLYINYQTTADADTTNNQVTKKAILFTEGGGASWDGTVTAGAFSGPLTGNVTGNCSGSSGSCTGNAATATQFSATTTVALTGDATGTSAASKKGWSVPVTLASSGVTAGSYGPSANASPAHGGTFSVPYITVDAKGRVTAASTKTITLPSDADTKVRQTLQETFTNAENHPLLLAYSLTSDTTASVDNIAYRNSSLYFKVPANGSSGTGMLYAPSYYGSQITLSLGSVSTPAQVYDGHTYHCRLNVDHIAKTGMTLTGSIDAVTERILTVRGSTEDIETSGVGKVSAGHFYKGTTEINPVSFSSNLNSGKKIGTITIGDTETDIYCNTGTVTPTGTITANQIAVWNANGSTVLKSVAASSLALGIGIATDTGGSQLALAHGGKYKLTVGGSSFIFTMPSSGNTDTKVRQNIPTDSTILSTNRPLLLSYLASSDTSTGNKDGVAYRSTGMYANISTNTITATGGFIGNLTGNSATATTLAVSSTTSIATTNGVQLISTTILSQTGYWLIETYSSGNYGFQRATSVADPACVAVRTKNNSTTWGSWTYSYAVWKA